MKSRSTDRQVPPRAPTGQRQDTRSIETGSGPPGGSNTLTVETVTPPAHRWLDAMPLQHRPIRPSGVLDPAVSMRNEPAWRAAALEGHDQGVDTQACLEVIGHGPAHDLARGQIL